MQKVLRCVSRAYVHRQERYYQKRADNLPYEGVLVLGLGYGAGVRVVTRQHCTRTAAGQAELESTQVDLLSSHPANPASNLRANQRESRQRVHHSSPAHAHTSQVVRSLSPLLSTHRSR